jgi:hypothetical protein
MMAPDASFQEVPVPHPHPHPAPMRDPDHAIQSLIACLTWWGGGDNDNWSERSTKIGAKARKESMRGPSNEVGAV